MAAFDKYLGDTYELVDLIKDTEKSFIALVYDKHAKRLCAMKQRDLRSLDLYKILKDSNNPHIPQIYRLFERDGKLIIIEEHIDGQSLEELLDYQSSIFNEKFVLNILLQLCDCLESLHQLNIINRDIKPSNIMLTKDHTVKLIDFGIARIFKPDSLADTEFLGTRGYAAPEQFGLFDVGQSDPRTDIHALGVTIKELLGKDYHGWLSEILERCTDLNPARRYQSIPELVQGIKRTRKSWLIKRFTLIGAIVSALVVLPQLIHFETSEEKAPVKSGSENLTIKQPSQQEDKADINSKTPNFEPSSTLNEEITKQLIDFTNSQNFDTLPIFNDISIEPIPASSSNLTKKLDYVPAEYPQLLLFINGKLSENSSTHSTAGYIYISGTDNYQNWQRNDKGDFLFPSNWTALLRIQNHTNSDIINSHLNVSLGKSGKGRNDKFSVDVPTIRAGQSLDINLPIANKVALYVLGSNNIHGNIEIFLRSNDDKYIAGLQREIKIR
ncbi:MAG: serine/threonine protein kinase [Selenomonadaceae bacterium]|nr:serine/threonine protein kinase [Selenomonadaceae bacterium]